MPAVLYNGNAEIDKGVLSWLFHALGIRASLMLFGNRKGDKAFFVYGFPKSNLGNWERGVKKPGGPALRLLTLIQKKGLEAIA